MAVTGDANTADVRHNTVDKARAVRSLVDQLGSTQHLDRERSRLELRAALQDTSESENLLLCVKHKLGPASGFDCWLAGSGQTVLSELQRRISQEPVSGDWHDRLAWLNAAEVAAHCQ